MKDLISIIVPVYNSSRSIEKCINSLQRQTYKNIEIICVNDGSTDNSLEILKKMKKKDKRIIVIDKKNEGVSIARNVGIRQSKGDFISFVDADDWVEENSIERLYDAMIKYNVDVVRGNYQVERQNGNTGEKGNLYDLANRVFDVKTKNFENEVIAKFLDGKMPCFVWLLMIRRDCAMKTNLFREQIALWEDCIFYFELCLSSKKVAFIDNLNYHYCDNDCSCVRNPDYYLRNLYEIIKVNKILKQDFKESCYESNLLVTKFNTRCLLMITTFLLNMLKTNKMKSSDIIKEAEKLSRLGVFCEIKNDSNLKYLKMYKRIPVFFMKYEKFRLMVTFFQLRKYMSKLKSKIKKEK